MRGRRLLWQLYPSYLLITLVSVFGVIWYASNARRDFYLDETVADLEARAVLVLRQISGQFGTAAGEDLDRLCKEFGKRTSTRITLILPDGHVVADTEEEPARMDDHADRPEIKRAMIGERGQEIRYSNTLHQSTTECAPSRSNAASWRRCFRAWWKASWRWTRANG